MSWVEVDGAGWSWVHGLVTPIFFLTEMMMKEICHLIEPEFIISYFDNLKFCLLNDAKSFFPEKLVDPSL